MDHKFYIFFISLNDVVVQFYKTNRSLLKHCSWSSHMLPLMHYGLKEFLLCSVLTPYYTEEVLFSLPELEVPNEDGVSILFYLQKIFPGLFFWCCHVLHHISEFLPGLLMKIQMNGTIFLSVSSVTMKNSLGGLTI